MPAGAHIRHLELAYDQSLGGEQLWDLLERVAQCFRPDGARMPFRLRQRGHLQAVAASGSGQRETWEAEGAELQALVETLPSNRGEKTRYRLRYELQMRSGFRLELTGEGEQPVLPRVRANLYRIRPEEFDEVHAIFDSVLGSENDVSFDVPLATRNVEAALEAGHGAFARHLIDQVLAARPKAPARQQDKHAQWWERLEELRQSMQGGQPPRQD